MTVEELVKLAMARTSEITSAYPGTRALAYRRVGHRQREVMTLAAQANPEYYGVCAISPLDENGATDLNDIIEPVPTPELIQLVRIDDGGEGEDALAPGTRITIVPADDLTAELAPRATLRDLVLQGVDDDLEGVVSVEIFYSRLSAVLNHNDADTAIELQPPYDELLVVDLTKFFLKKATRLDAEIRAASIALLDAEEVALLAQYLARVVQYAPVASRFRRPVKR